MRRQIETHYMRFNPETGKSEPLYCSPNYMLGTSSAYSLLPTHKSRPAINPDRHKFVRLKHFLIAEHKMRRRTLFGSSRLSPSMSIQQLDYTLAKINILWGYNG